MLPNSAWHMARPAQFHIPEDQVWSTGSGPHALYRYKKKSGIGEKKGLFH